MFRAGRGRKGPAWSLLSPGRCVPSEVCPCLAGTGMVRRERLRWLLEAEVWWCHLVCQLGRAFWPRSTWCPCEMGLANLALPAWISSLPKPRHPGVLLQLR